MSIGNLKNITLEQILKELEKKNNLIYVSTNTLLNEVSKILYEHNILSVPVFNYETKTFVGLIDTMELLKWICGEYFQYMRTNDLEKLNNNIELEFDFGLSIADDLIKSSSRARNIHIFDSHDYIETIMKALLLYQQHRILVHHQNEDEHNYYLLSQSDIVKYLFQNKNKMKELLNLEIVDLGLVNPLGSPIITIDVNKKAIEGFYKMYQYNIPSVAVIGEDYKLITNLSASDLRGMSEKKIFYLNLPILEFLEIMKAKNPIKPITCYYKESLLDLMKKILDTKVHRIWITDLSEKPIGLVTLTDIIRVCILKNKMKPNIIPILPSK